MGYVFIMQVGVEGGDGSYNQVIFKSASVGLSSVFITQWLTFLGKLAPEETVNVNSKGK